MPVMNRTWSEHEIQISDLAVSEIKRRGLRLVQVTALAMDYLNEPDAWTRHGARPEAASCSFLAPTGQQATITLGVATFGSLAIVSHVEVHGGLQALESGFTRIVSEIEIYDGESDYDSKPLQGRRTATVRFEKRGKQPPMQFTLED